MVGTNKQSPADDATYLRKVNITSYGNIVRLMGIDFEMVL